MMRVFLFTFLFAQLSSAVDGIHGPRVIWAKCPQDTPPELDCGSIKVPLAYKAGNLTAPVDNSTAELGLVRLNSTGRASKQGLLFFNPGGPGISATGFVAGGLSDPTFAFSSIIRDSYDIIGLDPRGTGRSVPVQCDPSIFNEEVATFVDNATGYERLVDYGLRLGESCEKLTGPILNHLDTLTVAKDHDVLREALGVSEFNFFGMSYGSLLGSQYLSLFPESVRRMSLDGLIDHSESESATLLTESTTYETTLDKFFGWCHQNSSCALHGQDVAAAFDRLLARADADPIPAPSATCKPHVTGEDLRYNVQGFLPFVDLPVGLNWIVLGTAIQQALQGNASLLCTPLASSTTPMDLSSAYAFLAIGCQDWSHGSRSVVDLELLIQMASTFAPRTRGATQTYYYQTTCLGWPAPLLNTQAPLNSRVATAPPVLLSNSIYDPECSIAWAEGLREELPTAVSITRNGYGHTSYFLKGETSMAIDEYLVTGKLPADGTVYLT